MVVDHREHKAGWNLQGTEKRVRSEKLPILRQYLLVTMLLGWSSGCIRVTSLLEEGGMLTVPIPQALQYQLALHLRCSSGQSSSCRYSSGHPSIPRSSLGPGGAGTQRWFENLLSNCSDTGNNPTDREFKENKII